AIFQDLGLNDRVITKEFVSVDEKEAGDAHDVARILTHRSIIERARLRGLRNVLVVENPTDLQRAVYHVAGQDRLKELNSRDWRIFLIGAHRSESDIRSDCAIAYHASVFDRILDEIPEQPDLAKRWMVAQKGWFNYLKATGATF
ncbi:MAG: hypothetical protein ACRER2_16280, partial [Methylococcales bacterium]